MYNGSHRVYQSLFWRPSMTTFTIYHNPRCSKSRQTLALLEQHNIHPNIIFYLDAPPTATELRDLLKRLGMGARELLRKGEDEYKQLGLADLTLSEAELIEAMVRHPQLIERPIVVSGDRASLGRPPENILELIGR